MMEATCTEEVDLMTGLSSSSIGQMVDYDPIA